MAKFVDNSRRSDHETCNRYYYWRHVRGLRASGKQAALDFGSCWHEAQDVMWLAVKNMSHLENHEIAQVAHEAFCQKWQGLGHPLVDQMTDDDLKYIYKARHTDTAYFLLLAYIEKRRNFIDSVELIEVEKPFIVPIDNASTETFYIGRMDKIVKWQGRVWVIEHKTTSWGTGKSGINANYIESYSPNSQVDGYAHAAKMIYGDAFKGVLVDIALVIPNNHQHIQFVPIERTFNNLDAWLWELKRQVKLMEINAEDLKEVHPGDPFMAAYPKNTKNCIQFMHPCPYMDICKAIENPQKEPDRIPLSYVEDHWSPIKDIDLKTLGIDAEED